MIEQQGLRDSGADVQPLTGSTGVKRTVGRGRCEKDALLPTGVTSTALELDSVSMVHHESASSSLEAPAGGVLVDYLRVTLPDDYETTWEALGDWLGPREARPVGWRSYYSGSAIVLDGGLVAWCDDPGTAEVRGVLVDLPGRACAALGAKLLPFMRWCLERGHIARVDYAIDDRTGLLTPQKVIDAWDRGDVVTRWRSYRETREVAKGGKLLGHTCYMGSRSSEAMVRVYDKALEQKKPELQWVRLELETKGKLAHALAAEVVEKGGAAVVGQLNRRIRFIDKGNDTNKRRWEPAAWWESFIGDLTAGPGLIKGKEPTCTIEKVADYLERQAGPSMAALLAAEGGDVGRLLSIASRSQRRLKPKHHAAVNQAHEQMLARLRRYRSENEATST